MKVAVKTCSKCKMRFVAWGGICGKKCPNCGSHSSFVKFSVEYMTEKEWKDSLLSKRKRAV